MKAVLCKSYGPPANLVLEEIDDPAPKAGEVLIDIYAAGLNFPDTLQIAGKYQFQPDFPFTPGSEVGGVVAILLTVAYTFGAARRIFFGPLSPALADKELADPRWTMSVPLLVVAAVSILLGLYPRLVMDLFHGVIGAP